MTEDGKNVLVFNATEKAWGPNYIKFDGNLATDFKGDLSWGLRVDYEKRWLTTWAANSAPPRRSAGRACFSPSSTSRSRKRRPST